MAKPTVGVVVTARNYAEFLPECLSSLATQTRRADAVLIVDDASTDDTPAVLRRLVDSIALGAVDVVRHTERRGLAASLNEGFQRLDTAFVAHVDADDVCLPDYLRRLDEALATHPEAGYAYPRLEMFGTETGIYASYPFDANRLMFEGNYIPNVGLIRRSAFLDSAGYRDLPTHLDWDFWLSLLEAGWPGVLVDEVLYRWRRHPAGMTYQPRRVRLRTRADIAWRHRRLFAAHGAAAPHWLASAFTRRVSSRSRARRGLTLTPSGWVTATGAVQRTNSNKPSA